VDLHRLAGQAVFVPFQQLVIHIEGNEVLVVEKGVVVEVFGGVEGEFRDLGVGLLATSAGSQQDLAGGVIVDLDIYLTL
jgi:hypothetical protein